MASDAIGDTGLSDEVEFKMQTRQRMQRWTIGTLAMAACGVAMVTPAEAQRLREGAKFPPFKETDLRTKKPIRLEDFRGRVVLVDFWATWCGPCVNELPNVKRAHKKYHKQGFDVISISLDTNVSKCRKFIEKNNLNWYHIADGRGWNSRLAAKHKIKGIPAAILIGKDGKIVSTHARGKDLDRAVKAALKQDYDGPVGEPPAGGPEPADPAEQKAQTKLAEADELRDAGALSAALKRYDAIGTRHADLQTGKRAKARAYKLRAALGIKGTEVDARARAAYERKAARDAGPWLTVARRLVGEKKPDVARKYYERVLDRFPGSEVARAARDELAQLSS